MKKMVSLMIPLFAAVLGITACGAGSKSAPAAETTAAAMDSAQESIAYDMESYKEESGGGVVNTSAEGTSRLPEGRKLIRTVNMQVETDQFDKMISGINAKLSELGGYVEQSDISGTSMNYRGEPVPRYANITARIPNNKLDSFVGTVSENGNVTNKSESTQDVTLQYSDVESRKKSLEIEQERIWQFLEKAESIDTVITLEQRLSEIRYQLESMESQLRLYDNQVDYSSVYLNISEVTTYTPISPESTATRIKNGLSENFASLVTILTNLLVLLITTCPYWIPLLIIAAILIAAGRRQNKKINERIEEERARSQNTQDPYTGAEDTTEDAAEDKNKDKSKDKSKDNT